MLFALAALLTARIVVEFFGRLAMSSWGGIIVIVTDYVVLPLGTIAPRTPYGGVFDTDAAISVVVLIVLEWALGIVRSRAYTVV